MNFEKLRQITNEDEARSKFLTYEKGHQTPAGTHEMLEKSHRAYGLSEQEAFDLVEYELDLNLTMGKLFGRRILDVGSAEGNFKNAIMKLADGVGYDKPHVVELDRVIYEEAMPVQGKAEEMPFKDGSFDFTLAHCSVPNLMAINGRFDLIPATIREMVRVTRPGGEIKIFPVFRTHPWGDEYEEKLEILITTVLEELKALHQKGRILSASIRTVKRIENSDELYGLLEIVKAFQATDDEN